MGNLSEYINGQSAYSSSTSCDCSETLSVSSKSPEEITSHITFPTGQARVKVMVKNRSCTTEDSDASSDSIMPNEEDITSDAGEDCETAATKGENRAMTTLLHRLNNRVAEMEQNTWSRHYENLPMDSKLKQTIRTMKEDIKKSLEEWSKVEEERQNMKQGFRQFSEELAQDMVRNDMRLHDTAQRMHELQHENETLRKQQQLCEDEYLSDTGHRSNPRVVSDEEVRPLIESSRLTCEEDDSSSLPSMSVRAFENITPQRDFDKNEMENLLENVGRKMEDKPQSNSTRGPSGQTPEGGYTPSCASTSNCAFTKSVEVGSGARVHQGATRKRLQVTDSSMPHQLNISTIDFDRAKNSVHEIYLPVSSIPSQTSQILRGHQESSVLDHQEYARSGNVTSKTSSNLESCEPPASAENLQQQLLDAEERYTMAERRLKKTEQYASGLEVENRTIKQAEIQFRKEIQELRAQLNELRQNHDSGLHSEGSPSSEVVEELRHKLRDSEERKSALEKEVSLLTEQVSASKKMSQEAIDRVERYCVDFSNECKERQNSEMRVLEEHCSKVIKDKSDVTKLAKEAVTGEKEHVKGPMKATREECPDVTKMFQTWLHQQKERALGLEVEERKQRGRSKTRVRDRSRCRRGSITSEVTINIINNAPGPAVPA